MMNVYERVAYCAVCSVILALAVGGYAASVAVHKFDPQLERIKQIKYVRAVVGRFDENTKVFSFSDPVQWPDALKMYQSEVSNNKLPLKVVGIFVDGTTEFELKLREQRTGEPAIQKGNWFKKQWDWIDPNGRPKPIPLEPSQVADAVKQ